MIDALLAQAGVLNVAAAIEDAKTVVVFEHSNFGAARGGGDDIVIVCESNRRIVHDPSLGNPLASCWH
ncbi:hypothetical protein D3C83_168090 [compost metagenome]